jgi:phosphonate transport system substrate-binding protein
MFTLTGSIARLIFMLACAGPGLGAATAAHAEESAGVLVLGRISDDPKSHYESMKVLLDYVVSHMGDVGITEGKVLMAPDALQMASYLRRGRVDWVSETAGGAMLLQRRAGAETFLLSDRNGIRRYHTIYFARRDGEVTSIDELQGHRIAFQNPTSTSAYFIPAMELLERGMNLEILGSPVDPPVPDSVGYVFARTERNIATWVHKNLVDVGAVSNLDWTNPRKIPEFFKSDFIILRESSEVPRGVEVVRQSLEPKVRARLREVLLGMADDPEAIGLLEQYHQSMRFFDLDEVDRKDLERLRAGVNKVSAEIE